MLAGLLALTLGAARAEPTSPAPVPILPRDPVEEAAAVAAVPLPDPNPEPLVLPPAVVLDSVEMVLPDEGRSIFVQKIAPPPGYVPPPVQAPASPPPPVPSEEFVARARAAAANRPETRPLRFSATVYPAGPAGAPGKATLVRWTHKGQYYVAWSSIDWNHFRGLGRFESADGRTIYSMMMGIGDATLWRQPPGAPLPPGFPPGEITFRIIVGDPGNPSALADLEALHALYRAEGHRLKRAHEIRERTHRERQAWLEANPPQPQDIIVRHWEIPEHGQAAPESTAKTEGQP